MPSIIVFFKGPYPSMLHNGEHNFYQFSYRFVITQLYANYFNPQVHKIFW
jgi:hypothetical protein